MAKNCNTVQTDLFKKIIPEKINTMQYRGNKFQVLDFITPHFKGAKIFLDLMAGSQSIGAYYKKYAKIISNDIQYYSYVLGKAYVENNKYHTLKPLPQSEIKSNPEYHLFSDYYSSTYFTPKQAHEIDAIRASIDLIRDKDEILSFCYLACLLKSLDVVSRTAGHFYGYLEENSEKAKLRQNKTVYGEFSKICKSFRINVSPFKNKCYNMPALDLLKNVNSVDIIYLDPPYNRRQYSNYYHILEMCAKYEGELNENSRTQLPKKRYKSAFCNRNKVETAFKELLEASLNIVKQKIIISYTNGGLLKRTELEEIFIEYSKDLEYYEKKVQYTRQKTSNKVDIEKEMLFILNL